MRGLWQLTVVEFKLFFREPFATFFTFFFPLMLLVVFGSIFGNAPSEMFDGFGYVDFAVPSFTALIIASSGLMTITSYIATYREKGILKRLQASPVRPHLLLGAQILVTMTMTLVGMAILVAAGSIIYGLRFEGSVLGLLAAFIISCFSFFAIGFVIAGTIPTARTAHIVSMAVFYPIIFLSGATIPIEIFPESVRSVAQLIPLTHAVGLIKGAWIGRPWASMSFEIIVLTAIFIAGVLISSKTFKWE